MQVKGGFSEVLWPCNLLSNMIKKALESEICAVHEAWLGATGHRRRGVFSSDRAQSLLMWYPLSPSGHRSSLCQCQHACITVYHNEPVALHLQLSVGLRPPPGHMNHKMHQCVLT
jgi:hypothetical protein